MALSTEIIGITTIVFGITSLLLISKARRRLSDGSLRKYMDNFSICLAFIVIFSFWQTIRGIYKIEIKFEGLSSYPEYIFIMFAYIAFVITSYRILKISEEFGFKEDGEKIRRVVSKKKGK